MVVVGPKWPAEIIVGPAIGWGVVLNDDIEVDQHRRISGVRALADGGGAAN